MKSPVYSVLLIIVSCIASFSCTKKEVDDVANEDVCGPALSPIVHVFSPFNIDLTYMLDQEQHVYTYEDQDGYRYFYAKQYTENICTETHASGSFTAIFKNVNHSLPLKIYGIASW